MENVYVVLDAERNIRRVVYDPTEAFSEIVLHNPGIIKIMIKIENGVDAIDYTALDFTEDNFIAELETKGLVEIWTQRPDKSIGIGRVEEHKVD